MGIENPVETGETAFNASKYATRGLALQIINQDMVVEDTCDYISTIRASKQARKQLYASIRDRILQSLDNSDKTVALFVAEKGTSYWLTTQPDKDNGFFLSRQKFRDAVRLRYNISLGNMPSLCACGSKFSTQHALTCKVGGFVSRRHNDLRNCFGGILGPRYATALR